MPETNDWQEALNALDTLISGKPRSDGTRWADAFDMMRVYIQAYLNAQPLHVLGSSKAPTALN